MTSQQQRQNHRRIAWDEESATQSLELVEVTPVEPYEGAEDTNYPARGQLSHMIVDAETTNRTSSAFTAETKAIENFTIENEIWSGSDGITFLTTYLKILLGRNLYHDHGVTIKFSKIAIRLFNAIGILQAFGYVKDQILFGDFRQEKIKSIVYLGFACNNLLFRLYFLLIVCVKYDSILGLIKDMTAWKSMQKEQSTTHIRNKIVLVVWICLGTSITAGTLWPFIIAGTLWEWDTNSIILYQSYHFSLQTYVWSETNVTILLQKYGSTVKGETIGMAATGSIVDIFGYVQEYVIKDVGLITALTMLHFTKEFGSSLLRKQDSYEYSEIWEKYRMLRCLSENIDKTFGTLISLIHVDNLLFCAYFVFQHVNDASINLITFIQVLHLVKIVCFYAISAKASSVNNTFRKWIRTVFPSGKTNFIEESQHVSTITIFDELTTDPIGVGSNMFFIDKTFNKKFTSAVGSYFLFFNDSTGA